MRIINIGSLNLDYVYRVDTFPKPGETKSSESLQVNAGGKGLNQSITLAKAGCQVFHAGVWGGGGQMLVEELERYGVHTALLLHRPEVQNGHAIIEVADSGQNSILLYGGTNQALTEQYIQSVLEACQPGDLLLLQNETNGIAGIIEAASARGIPIAMNIAPMNAAVAEYELGKLRWIIVNELEAAALAGGEDFAQTMENLSRAYPHSGILMTLGTDGVWLRDGSEEIRMSALKVENVVDTTAAGDTFLGYFLAGVTMGADYVTALEQATCASALAIQTPGAARSVPDRETLLAYWQENRHRLRLLSL